MTATNDFRERLPTDRAGINHKFSINGHECYLTANMYPDGRLGELFIVMGMEGSTASGLMDTIGILVSLALQHHVPLSTLVSKFKGAKFEPYEQGKASSLVDYIFTWLEREFPGGVHRSVFQEAEGSGV